jgi:hypothetical protein
MAVTPISSFTIPANAVGIGFSGYSLTGSNSFSAIQGSGTWNTTGTPSFLSFNLTDTASNANSLLLDFKVNNSIKFSVKKNGDIFGNSIAGINAKLNGSTSGVVTIQPQADAGTYTLTLPNSAGSATQVLTTDGSGNLSWTTPSAGGGSSAQITEVSTSRALANTDAGNTLVCTTATLTLTIAAGLTLTNPIRLVVNGNTTIAREAGVTINGASDNIQRNSADNRFVTILRTGTNTWVVDGV